MQVAGQVDAGAEVVVVFVVVVEVFFVVVEVLVVVVEVCSVVVGVVEAHVDEPEHFPLTQVRSPSQSLSLAHEAPVKALAARCIRIITL